MHHAAPFMRQDHEHKQHLIWTVGTAKKSIETKSLTWLFRKTFHIGEGVSSGIIENLMTIKSLEQERLPHQGCSQEEKMSRIVQVRIFEGEVSWCPAR
jgi:hypothetical protein